MKENKKDKIVEVAGADGEVVKVGLRQPGSSEINKAQLAYNRAFRDAMESGALLRQKLEDYMKEQGIWNEAKQKQNDKFVKDINDKEDILNSGGIKLADAKEIALDLRVLRAEFREFLSEKNALDQNTAEGQADNARFSELVRLCLINPATRMPFFPEMSDYENNAGEPWVIEAASQLANMIYGLDPKYDDNLPENEFLVEFNFVNEDLRLINENGHLVDSEGRLITEDARYVAYRSKEAELAQDVDQRYFVNRDGEEVVQVKKPNGSERWVRISMAERKPFLDDEGNPIITASESSFEEEQDLVASDIKGESANVEVEDTEKSEVVE